MICKKCNKEIPDGSVYCMHCGHKQALAVRNKKVRGNGQGSVYKLPNGKWRAAVTLGYVPIYNSDNSEKPRKKRIYKTKSDFKTKKEAVAYLPHLQSKKDETKKINITELYEIWKESHFAKISKSGQSTYKTAYKKISPLYLRNISDIKLTEMQKIVDETKGGYYPKRDIKMLLSHLYRYAMIEDYCTKNYAQYITLPPLEKSKKDAFTLEERNKLWADYEKGNEFTGYILIMIYTGMRYGEISTILLKNIFLNEKYMIGGIKTDAGKNRVIPLKEEIIPIVNKFYNEGEKKLLEMPEKDFYDKFKETLTRAGVRQLTPHCCRHTLATMMASEGVQPAIIQATAGHKNYSTTIGYTHISLDDQLKAINSLE